MSRIRVMHVIRPSEGGIKNHLLTLITHSDQTRFEHMVVCPAGEMAKTFNGAGVKTFELPLGGELSLTDLTALKRLVSLFSINRVDISHCHGSKAGLVGRLAARWACVPAVVMTVHNSILHHHLPPWKKMLYAECEGYLAGYTHRIITVSDALGREIISLERISPEKVVTIYNGISPDKFRLGADRQYLQETFGIPASAGVVVGTVARLAPQKGVINFIRAAAGLSELSEGLAFLVVGGGPLRAELERQSEALNLTGRLFFVGERQDVMKIMPCLDVFVLASLTEGLPLAVLEAMACRCPVVASGVGGIPEIIADGVTGILVKPGDVTALASAIGRLINDPGIARRMGNEGLNRVLGLFTAGKMARETEDVYTQLIYGTADIQCTMGGGN